MSYTKILTFWINKKKYGISIENIITIEKNDSKITDIPQSDEIIRGVINFRSRICPIIDLSVHFEDRKNELTPDKKIIVIEKEDKIGALLVDDTDNIIEVHEDNIENVDIDSGDTKVVNQNEDLFVLLEIENIDELLERGEE